MYGIQGKIIDQYYHEEYYGKSETEFKSKHNNHMQPFRHNFLYKCPSTFGC